MRLTVVILLAFSATAAAAAAAAAGAEHSPHDAEPQPDHRFGRLPRRHAGEGDRRAAREGEGQHRRALARAGESGDRQVDAGRTTRLVKLPLLRMIELIGDAAGVPEPIGAEAEDGVVIVSTEADLRAKTTLRLFDVRELVESDMAITLRLQSSASATTLPVPSPEERFATSLERLEWTIMESIEPESCARPAARSGRSTIQRATRRRARAGGARAIAKLLDGLAATEVTGARRGRARAAHARAMWKAIKLSLLLLAVGAIGVIVGRSIARPAPPMMRAEVETDVGLDRVVADVSFARDVARGGGRCPAAKDSGERRREVARRGEGGDRSEGAGHAAADQSAAQARARAAAGDRGRRHDGSELAAVDGAIIVSTADDNARHAADAPVRHSRPHRCAP